MSTRWNIWCAENPSDIDGFFSRTSTSWRTPRSPASRCRPCPPRPWTPLSPPWWASCPASPSPSSAPSCRCSRHGCGRISWMPPLKRIIFITPWNVFSILLLQGLISVIVVANLFMWISSKWEICYCNRSVSNPRHFSSWTWHPRVGLHFYPVFLSMHHFILISVHLDITPYFKSRNYITLWSYN